MIVRPRPGLWQLFFILRGSIVPRVLPQLVIVGALSVFVVWMNGAHPGVLPHFTGGPFAFVGIALSIFLSFRNQACYDRWWEGRRQWGELIAASRHFARQTLVLGPGHAQDRAELVRLAIAFAHSLVPHLRGPGDPAKAARFLPPGVTAASPDDILMAVSVRLADLNRERALPDMLFASLDHSVSAMGAVQAACERIRTTPVPFGYMLLLHRTAYVFCFLLPFGFADSVGWGTPMAAMLVAYTFFGLDVLGEELEEPFGLEPNDLPIAALADGIEISLREALGETDLPPPPVPVDFFLA